MLRELVVGGGGLGASGNRDCQRASKNSYSNNIRAGYYRMDQIREGVSGDGLGGNFWEEGLPPCIHSQPMVCSHSPVAVRSSTGCTTVERTLTATRFKSLLVNLESMASKPNAGGGSKNCATWKVEKAVHYFVNADRVTTDSSTD